MMISLFKVVAVATWFSPLVTMATAEPVLHVRDLPERSSFVKANYPVKTPNEHALHRRELHHKFKLDRRAPQAGGSTNCEKVDDPRCNPGNIRRRDDINLESSTTNDWVPQVV
ncbi:hypothetical protein PYCC9005_002540 [Savitreella phatthalungensis]